MIPHTYWPKMGKLRASGVPKYCNIEQNRSISIDFAL